MELILLRHGKAADRATWTGADADRPLTPAGEERTRAVLAHLAGTIQADEIWTSPWLRARGTAEIAGEEWGLPVREQPWLAGDGDTGASLSALAGLGDERRVVLVGHEPDLGVLAGTLCGGVGVLLKKTGVAILRGDPRPGGMLLRVLLNPGTVLGIAAAE